jgi:hypothetical protein
MTVKVIDHGWDRIVKDLKTLKSGSVSVGFPQEGETKTPSGAESVPFSDMVTRGVVHEFGSLKRNIPARPFMRPAFDNNVKEIAAIKEKILQRFYRGLITPSQALDLLGLKHVSQIKAAINAVDSPPLKNPGPKRGKSGHINILVNTSQMRNSVQYTKDL